MIPEIFITHYVDRDRIWLNDMVVDAVTFMEKVTEFPHEVTVISYSPDGSDSELYERLPQGIRVVKKEEPEYETGGMPLLNTAIELAKDVFVILQNDIRVSHGWLTALLTDFLAAEIRFGRRCVMSMRFIPYHYIPGTIELRYPDLWKEIQEKSMWCDSSTMSSFCKQYGFKFENDMVYSVPKTGGYFTDDGHMLMMWMSRKKCVVPEMGGFGYYDDDFRVFGPADCDWGVRALKAGFKNLQSQTSLIGHSMGATSLQPKRSSGFDGTKVFIKKWGMDMYDEMQTGELWIRLHKEQKERSFENKISK